VEFICPECGAAVEVRDIRAVLLALHMTNDCSQVSTLIHQQGGA